MRSFEEWVIEFATERDGEFQGEILTAVAEFMRTAKGEALLATLNRIHESAHVTCEQIQANDPGDYQDDRDTQWEAG
jgi:hypothetical protein